MTTLRYAIPVLLVAVPALIYAVAPDFYLRFVLNDQMREYQAVEMTTFACALVGGGLLAWAAWGLWRRRPGPDFGPPGLRGWPDRHGGYALVAVCALASVFLAGEEVNWGQTFLHWGVGERDQDRDVTLNLHNTADLVSVQGLGSVFIMTVFLVIPAVWLFRRPLNLPGEWRPAVPIGAATLAVVLGLALSTAKDIYIATQPDHKTDPLYINYFEQLNEQKEMLFAAAMLLYGWGALTHRTEPTSES